MVLRVLVYNNIMTFILFFMLVFRAIGGLGVGGTGRGVVFVTLYTALVGNLARSAVGGFVFVFVLTVTYECTFSSVGREARGVVSSGCAVASLVRWYWIGRCKNNRGWGWRVCGGHVHFLGQWCTFWINFVFPTTSMCW